MGPAPVDPTLAGTWDCGNRLVAEARVWLDTHTAAATLAPTRIRSRLELEDRRSVLDATFAVAPADNRGLIDQLRAGGTLPFDDVAALLSGALAAQGERRQWILEHWPHVVEYAQIGHQIDRALAGPDLTRVLGTLTVASNQQLAGAASDGQPWLVTLASGLTAADQDTPTPDVAQLLGDIVDHRHRWDITHPDPLGTAVHDPEQAAERMLLSLAIDHAHDRAHPDRTLEVEWVEPDTPTLTAFDDAISR